MLRSYRMFLVLLLATGLAACGSVERLTGAQDPAPTAAEPPPPPPKSLLPEQRAVLEERMLAILLGMAPLQARPDTRRYVSLVGHWLLADGQDPDRAWRFLVLDDPAILVAGLPGGTVVVTTGLLAELETEAELAAALAQGIGLVRGDAYVRGLSADGLAMNDTHLMAVARARLVEGPVRDAVTSADAMAVRLLADAGYDPWALPALLQRWAAAPGDRFSDLGAPQQGLEGRLGRLQGILERDYAVSGGAEIASRLKQHLR